MGKLNRSIVYRGFKSVLTEQYGWAFAHKVWKTADFHLCHLLKEHRNAGSDEKMMILPLYALYRSMQEHGVEDALVPLKAYGAKKGASFSAIIRKITGFPGLPRLLWRNMPALMRKTSSPQKGYRRNIISETKELVGVDILTCPLHELAKQLGAPEITAVVCLIDKGQMTGFRQIDYTRTKALGDGDALCDYRLRFHPDK